MSTLIKEKDQNKKEEITLNLKKGSVSAIFKIWSIKEGDFTISILPSLGISGYGKQKEDAINMLDEALGAYFTNLIGLKKKN